MEALQFNAFVECFSDIEFQSLIIIPKVRILKCEKQNSLMANVWVLDKYYSHTHPFILPDLFKGTYKRDQFKVRYMILHKFTSETGIQKIFMIKEFLKKYQGKISNQRLANLKREIIRVIEILKQFHLIESDFKIISNGHLILTDELTIHNISEGFVIYEKI